MKQNKFRELINYLTASGIATAIQNYEDDIEALEEIYDRVVADDIAVELDDLLYLSMKLGFLEGMIFQKAMEKL